MCFEDTIGEQPVAVPVPSRLYFRQSERLPLAGVNGVLSSEV